MELPSDFAQEVQQAWHRFLQRTEPVRPDLHRYCRALTGSVWDAEDLVQDTLLRAFGKLGDIAPQIDNPKAYLLRIASNLWVDHFRRAAWLMPPPERPVTSHPEQSLDIRDAAKQLMQLLPPQERVAFVLKEVFDFRLEEIATILHTTVGAIKAALHRGRGKLAAPLSPRPAAPASAALLDQFVAAFNARDLDRVTALLRADATGEVVSMGTWYGRTAIRDSVLYYSLFLEQGGPRAERRVFCGESVVALWYALDDPNAPIVRDVLRCEELEGQIAQLRFFALCPETLIEVVGALGLPVKTNGYGVWAPEFLERQKRAEFEHWVAQRANAARQ
jgi:RNA polymerase sigma-70 factor (ECF subfamily)